MKTLSLLFSLLLGATVLLIFVQPWDALEKLLVPAATRDAAPAKPLTPPDSTATVETTPAKPPEAAAAPPAVSPPEAPKAAEPADPKTTHMLGAEKAESERNAALQQKAATPLPRETKLYFKVRVRDAGRSALMSSSETRTMTEARSRYWQSPSSRFAPRRGCRSSRSSRILCEKRATF